MIQMIKREEYPQMEVPQSYIKYVELCIDELDMILHIYNLPQDIIEYDKIKEVNEKLRIYFRIPKLSEELYDEEYLIYNTLQTIVFAIIDKWERHVDILNKKGLL